MPMLAIIALLGAQAAAMPDPVLVRMASLYDEVCLQAFPIDAAIDKVMIAKGGRPLTADEVKITLVDDPGRGWEIKDGSDNILVILELPPFHASTVRRMTDAGFDNPRAYRAIVDPYERAHPDFAAMPPYDRDMGDLHVHAIGEQRALPGGGTESLFVFDQHIIDPAKRAAGSTRVNVRFVHQIRMSP